MSSISRLLRRAEAEGIDAVDRAIGAPFAVPNKPVVHPTYRPNVPEDLDERARELELGMEPPDNRMRAQAVEAYVPPKQMPLPDYVKHHADATRTGMLSAQAMVMEYESAAKAIEELGAELHTKVEATQAQIEMLANAFTALKETASAYREEATRVFNAIEDCASTAAKVSELCSSMRDQISHKE